MLNTEIIYKVARKRCLEEMQTHFDEQAFERRIQPYLNDVKSRYESEKFAQNYQVACPLKNATTGDYNSKSIELPNGEFVLSSLRFYALNPARPFIMIEFSTRELTGDNIQPLLQQIKERYHHLAVHKYHFTSKEDISQAANLAITRDKIWVKGLMTEHRPAKFNDERVELILMNMTDAQYAAYKEELELFLNNNEPLRGELNLEDRKYLDQLSFSRFLFEIRIEGNYAGFMAVDEGFEYSCYGLAVIEEFLFHPYRGKGYGKIVQSKLIDALINLGWAGTYLYGCISPQNIASLKTAAANRRQSFLYSYFVECL